MDKVKQLHDEIIEKVREYYSLAHAPAQNAPFVYAFLHDKVLFLQL